LATGNLLCPFLISAVADVEKRAVIRWRLLSFLHAGMHETSLSSETRARGEGGDKGARGPGRE
jgi:hypothetical protein